MADIMKPKESNGLSGLGKLVGATVGVVTGDPMAVAGAVTGGTALGNAINTIKTGGKAIAGGSGQTENNTGNSDSSSQPSPIDRAIDQRNNTPDMIIQKGIDAIDQHPDIDGQTKIAMIEPLLRAKFFGPGGGLNGDAG